jgi:UDP-glucose 4-epimerase
MTKKILITGGNGFIARSIVESFQDSYTIHSFSRQQLDLLDSDAVSKQISKEHYDVVIHSATYDAAPKTSSKDPSLVLENNLRMFYNIARCKNDFGKMIYFGSGAEFGREHWQPKMDENYFDKHVPSDQYGYSKYLMTKYALMTDNIFNLRIFGLFGQYDDWRYRFIPNNCARAAFDLPLKINQNNRFDFMFIDDLVNVVEWAINNRPKHQAYNVCSGDVQDFISIAQTINESQNKGLEMLVKNKEIKMEYSGDNRRLMSEVGDLQFTPLIKASAKICDHFANAIRDRDKHLITEYT